MKDYSVKQVAKLSGVSVRTLHHYDEVGLLKPACIGENGYRYYGRKELLRLQQILFHRELDFSLDEIKRVLDTPEFDRAAALRSHREKLLANARRYRRLVRTIDQTLADLNGAAMMQDKAMYRGFDPERQADYEKWLVDSHGPQMQTQIDEAKSKMQAWRQSDFDAMTAEMEAIESGMAKALVDGSPPGCASVTALMRRHHAWVARSWKKPPTAAAFTGLGQLYLDHPDFRARYDARQPGLAEYMAEAIRQFGERELT